MREEKGKRLHGFDLNPEFLELLAKHKNENFQVKFILEAAGYGEIQNEQEETEELGGKVKKLFKDIFKKVG